MQTRFALRTGTSKQGERGFENCSPTLPDSDFLAGSREEEPDGGIRQAEAEPVLPRGHAGGDQSRGEPAGPLPFVDRPAGLEDRAQRDQALPLGGRRDRQRAPYATPRRGPMA